MDNSLPDKPRDPEREWDKLKNNRLRRERLKKEDNQFDNFWGLDIGSQYTADPKKRVPNEEIYSHCIDFDKYDYRTIVDHHVIGEFIRSLAFRGLIMFLVILNAIIIGLQTMSFFKNDRFEKVFDVVEAVILTIFLVEIGLKLIYDWELFWKSWWNRLDFIVMFVIVISGSLQMSRHPKFIIVVRVFRTFRSLRTVMIMKSITMVQETIENSIKGMINILLVLLIFMTVLACMGVILFDVHEIRERTNAFLNVFNAWFVIFICITQDGWVTILDEFRKMEYAEILIIWICIAIFVGAFVFANVIVAVIVTNLENALKKERYRSAMSINRLTEEGSSLKPNVFIHSLKDISSDHVDVFAQQRPMKLPNFKHISSKRLHTYIQLILHLEQNKLESAFIQKDLIKIMSLHISIFKQLQVYGPALKPEIEKGLRVIDYLKTTRDLRAASNPIEKYALIDELKRIENEEKGSRRNI